MKMKPGQVALLSSLKESAPPPAPVPLEMGSRWRLVLALALAGGVLVVLHSISKGG